MTKTITKSREAFRKNNEDNLLGLSIVRLSGFRICQLLRKKSFKNSLSERKTLRELFYSKEKK